MRAGGGFNHRIGLFDGLLVKDNHIANRPLKELAPFLQPIVSRSRCEDPRGSIEIEVDSLEQLTEVLKVDSINVILLDNMDCPRMQMAVEMRDRIGKKGGVELEASGGVTLETVRQLRSPASSASPWDTSPTPPPHLISALKSRHSSRSFYFADAEAPSGSASSASIACSIEPFLQSQMRASRRGR